MSGQAKFVVGDMVKLISGGPLMTVLAVGEGVQCQWFEEESLQSGVFPPECLMLMTEFPAYSMKAIPLIR